VTARVIRVIRVEEATPQQVIEIEILSSEDIENMVNLTKNRVGQRIQVVVLKRELKGIEVGDKILARVVYKGDEHGGLFYASQIHKIK
jgi:low affinity Fe/Cu permease